MKKILYIITQSEWGGAQRYVFDLAINLQSSTFLNKKGAGCQVRIAAGGNGPLFTRLEAQKLATTRLKHLVRAINPYHDLMAYFELKKLLGNIKPDIVHLNSSKAGILGSLAAKKAGIPKIIYTANGFVFNEPLPFWKKWLYKKIELFSSRRIDKIITVSDFDRQTGITAGIDPNKLITIHNGIDANAMNFLSREEARLSLRAKPASLAGEAKPARGWAPSGWGSYNRNKERLPDSPVQRDDKPAPSISEGIAASLASTLAPRNDKVIGTIANFYPTKGIDVLIQAMKNIDAALILIGDGPEEKKLRVKSYELREKIFFTGPIKNASQYLKAFDLFVLPSRKEGLSYTLLEAAMAGVPIVATKVGGTPEIIQDNSNGYLCAPNDANDLADKIKKALALPLQPKISGFDLPAMAAKTKAIYES